MCTVIGHMQISGLTLLRVKRSTSASTQPQHSKACWSKRLLGDSFPMRRHDSRSLKELSLKFEAVPLKNSGLLSRSFSSFRMTHAKLLTLLPTTQLLRNLSMPTLHYATVEFLGLKCVEKHTILFKL